MVCLKQLQALVLLFSTSALADGKHGGYNEHNFRATFGSQPAPWKIDVSPKFIEDTKFKASLTRFAIDINEPDFTSGPPRHNVTTVRDHWVDEYDWFKVQEELNKKFKHFTTTVTTGPVTNYSHPIPLHFVHHRSPRKDAIPLLFSHGWPGSFLEVGNILDGLLDPPNASDPAFHVVAPSIPGFGFSPAPKYPRLGQRETARAYNSLMHQLGYEKYVVQGGDWGGIILRYIAGLYPKNVVSVLSNFWFITPSAEDRARYETGQTRPDENVAIEKVDYYFQNTSGYRIQQETRPLQLGIGLTDSPLGNLMWMYDLMLTATDYHRWAPAELITWSMMYYIQGPVAGLRYYKEAHTDGLLANLTFLNTEPFVTQPVAISEFPKDIWSAPLDWARRRGNVVQRVVHDRGGHFAAYEAPDLLLEDIRKFWGNETLSGTGVFRR